MEHNIGHLRKSYEQDQLRLQDIGDDPIAFFHLWMNAAQQHPQIEEANAMSLATVDSNGRPHTRVVLLKAYDAEGFVFYTNHNSQKGRAMAQNPKVCLSFFWPALERQVRINGSITMVDVPTATAYFETRPRGSQLGAHASNQSQEISDPSELEKNLKVLEARFAGRSVPMPKHWGGYLVKPDEIEFWQGRPNRLHHRVRCRLVDKKWNMSYLAP